MIYHPLNSSQLYILAPSLPPPIKRQRRAPTATAIAFIHSHLNTSTQGKQKGLDSAF
nr:MAG TPA: hypothetical protein [Caudoviricetes sp.]